MRWLRRATAAPKKNDHHMSRILTFGILIILALILPWWLVLALSFMYAMRYFAYELVFLGVVLDSVYAPAQAGGMAPVLYTVSMVVIVFVVEIIKPYLSFGKV